MTAQDEVKDTNRIERVKRLPNTPEEESDLDSSKQALCCPECGEDEIYITNQDEKVCENCDLVIEDESIDHGPEWRAFTQSEKDDKSRVGSPMTNRLHDKGLSTMIDSRDSDAYGNAISSRQQNLMQRLRTWNERFRTKDAQERNLKQALGEIDRMASALGLPGPVRETAGVLYRRAVEERLLPGRSIEGMATASLYAAARQQGSPRSLSEFSTVSRVEELRIQRAYRYLSRELDLEIAPTNPTRFVPRYTSDLGLSQEAETLAIDILKTASKKAVFSGKSPVGLAAAALYAASRLSNESLTQEAVSDVTQVSKVTIRNRYQELLEAQ